MNPNDSHGTALAEAPPEMHEHVRDAEAQALAILGSIPDGFIGLDRQWRITYANPAVERMLGRSRAEFLYKHIWEVVPEIIGSTLEKECRRAMTEKVRVEFHDYFVPAESYYQVLASPCEDGIVIFLRDVTEGKELREALEESEAWRRLIIENVKDFAIFSMDAQGRVTLWNPGAEKVFGYSADEMLGQTPAVLYTPEDRAANVEENERITAAESGHAIDERWHLRKDGSRFFVSGAVVPLFDEHRMLRGFTKVARDITHRKQLEDELITAREHLEATVNERTARLRETIGELEAFSYSLSHDMRTPLRAMRSFSQLLSMKLAGKVDPEDTDHLKRIINAAERLDRLIQDVLSYNRLARGSIQLERVDLEGLIVEIIREHPSLDPGRAEVKIESPLLPVLGHEASLSQCISNLLTNAAKFVAPGAFPRIRVWTESLNSHVRLWVEDNGIGIPKEDQERIFGMFQRLHGQEEYEGTGIGLAIVHKAVERMGGHAGVESVPGQGSRFWVQLQRANHSS